ncbi:MspA family porin [Nocardia miyunensis]|uniref:MspA family porin n=1 Tax=Nocardia miyunensis TaxID=282684 RepID=UPI000835AD35|nr:MspA family porin [Nocardia miyunensis]
MRENQKAGDAWVARAVGIAVASTAAIGMLSTGAANADTFVPLPNGHIDRPGVTIDSVGNSVKISPSLAANGAGRVAWLTSHISTKVQTPDGKVGPWNGPKNDDGTNNSSTHGSSAMSVGYLVGCQVSLGSLSAGISAGISTSPSLSGSLSLPLAPGEVKFVNYDQIDMTKSGEYFFDLKDQQVEIQGCGGYAQARQVVTVEIIGTEYAKTNLYGQPFSLG